MINLNRDESFKETLKNKKKHLLETLVVNEILKINPQNSLSEVRTYSQKLFKNETDIEHYIEGLRKAGLPE